jgi:hypothetical protein
LNQRWISSRVGETHVEDHGLVVCGHKDPAVRQKNAVREELYTKINWVNHVENGRTFQLLLLVSRKKGDLTALPFDG